MKQIQRNLFILVCLLMGIGGYADNFKIIRLDKSSGDANCTLTAKMGSTDIDNSTEIPEGTLVTLTVSCGTNYSLKSLTYEEVTTIDQAEAPRRATPPPYVSVYDFNIEVNYPQYAVNHFAGDYTFYMPKNNIIVTATYTSLTTFHNNTNINFSISGSTIYDGTERSLIVKDGETPLREGLDFRITAMTLNGSSTGTDHTIQKAGNYVVTVQGIGKYQDSKESGPLTINQKALTVTAQNQTYTYGGIFYNSIYFVNTTGLVNGDVLTGILLTPSTSNATGDTPGTITPSAAVITRGSSDFTDCYSISYQNGTLVIYSKNIGSTTTGTKAVVTFSGTDYDETNKYFRYNGNPPTRTIVVTFNSNELALNTDYTVSTAGVYQGESPDLSKPDIYVVTISFIGNYTGSMDVEYQVRKEVTFTSSNRWRTYCETEVNMAVPDGFLAYTIDNVNTTTIEVSAPRDYIKKDVPMLLYHPDASTSFYPEIVRVTTDVPGTWGSDSRYKHNATDQEVSDILAAANTSTQKYDMWILVNDQFMRSKSGNLSAGKCYLLLQSDFYPETPLLIGANTTGITTLNVDRGILSDDSWYTLDGRRLQGRPTQKGLYVTNGKKMIIK